MTPLAPERHAAPIARADRRRRARRIVLLVGVVLTGLALLDVLVPAPSGPTSSSYATSAGGLRAWADLLGRTRHPVTRLRQSPGVARLDPATTLVVLDPDVVLASEARVLRAFVAAGGRLVAGGQHPEAWLRDLLDPAPAWVADATGALRAPGPSAGLPDVSAVRAAGPGSWTRSGAARPLLAGPRGFLLLEAAVGRGRLLLLADASPVQNRLLGDDDDAALAVALAGEPGRPVQFLETVHGYGQARGLGALPGRWQRALAGLALAALVWLAAHARRLGPPEEEARPLAPPRRAYVDAVAALLVRARDPAGGSAPVHRAARERLVRRAALEPDANADAVLSAARSLGLGEEEARALTAPAQTDAELLATGRALAKLKGGRR